MNFKERMKKVKGQISFQVKTNNQIKSDNVEDSKAYVCGKKILSSTKMIANFPCYFELMIC